MSGTLQGNYLPLKKEFNHSFNLSSFKLLVILILLFTLSLFIVFSDKKEITIKNNLEKAKSNSDSLIWNNI